MPGDLNVNNSMSLKEIWTNVANSNKDGDPNSIDSSEQSSNCGSIYFIEEGMTEQEFYAKNYAIYDTQPKMQNGMLIYEIGDMQKEKLSSAVSRVVNQMLDNGEFESKKDVIMGKIMYMDNETQKRVLDQLPENERQVVQQDINDKLERREQALQNLRKDSMTKIDPPAPMIYYDPSCSNNDPDAIKRAEKEVKNLNGTAAGKKALELRDKSPKDYKERNLVAPSAWNDYVDSIGRPDKHITSYMTISEAMDSIVTYSVQDAVAEKKLNGNN